MSSLDFVLIEIFGILSFLIIMFIYSIIASDLMTSLIIFSLFLFLLIPFYMALDNLQFILLNYGLDDIIYIKILLFYSNLGNIFIGTFLIIQLVYLIIHS